MNFSRQLTQSAIWIAAFLASGILILFAYNMYPVPDGDSIFFLPAIKAYASTGIVDNKVVDLSFDTDPKGLGRFLFYTPGFPVLTGSAMALFRLSSYKGVLLFVSFARAASVLLLAQAIAILLKKYDLQRRPFYALFASLIIFSPGLFLFASNGRPEIISMLVVSIGILVAVQIRSKLLKNATLAICIGALYPVSIANGIIASVFYLFYLFFDVERLRTRFAFVALVLASGLLFFAVSYAAAGLPLVDGLRGLSLHSKMQLGRDDTGLKLIVSYWKSWILFAVLSLIYLIFNLRSVLELRRSPLASLNRV